MIVKEKCINQYIYRDQCFLLTLSFVNFIALCCDKYHIIIFYVRGANGWYISQYCDSDSLYCKIEITLNCDDLFCLE